jgi:hypothetical protein
MSQNESLKAEVQPKLFPHSAEGYDQATERKPHACTWEGG